MTVCLYGNRITPFIITDCLATPRYEQSKPLVPASIDSENVQTAIDNRMYFRKFFHAAGATLFAFAGPSAKILSFVTQLESELAKRLSDERPMKFVGEMLVFRV